MRALFLLFLLLSGCMLGPKKSLPDMQMPASYAEISMENPSSQELGAWWKQFQDPVLDNLVEEALSNNLDIQIALERICEMRGTLRISSSKLWPSLDFFGAGGRIKPSQDPARNSLLPALGVLDLFTIGFDASWEIDLFGKNRSAKQAAFYELLSTQEQSYSVQLTVISEVIKLYTEIREAQQKILVLQKKIRAFEQLLQLSCDLQKSGLNNTINVEIQIAELNRAKSQLPDLEKTKQQSIYYLAFILGKKPEEFQDAFSKILPIPQAAWKVPVGLPSDLLRRRPDIRSAECQVYAAGARVGEAKASLFPSFSLTGMIGGLSQDANRLFKPTSRFWLVWPSIDWSLFQGGKTLGDIQAKSSQHRQALLYYQHTVLYALKDVESALVAYAQENQKIADLYLQWKARRNIASEAKQLLSCGLQDMSYLLQQYTEMYQTQNEYISSKATAMKNLISLYKALGGGWENRTKDPQQVAGPSN